MNIFRRQQRRCEYPIESELTMKQFGIVKTFNETQGRGSINPDSGGKDLSFARNAFTWDRMVSPRVGQRLSFVLGTIDGETCAVHLQST